MSTTPPEAIGKAVVVALPNVKCYEFSFPEFPRFMVIEEIIGSEGAYDWKINGTRR